MAHAGLLLRVLGGVPYLAACENMAKAEAAIGLAPDAARRLGALGVAIVEDAERLSQKLRLSNAEHTRLTAMAASWRRFSPRAGEGAARALLYRLKETAYTDSALLAWARSQASDHDAPWRELVTLPRRFTPPAFPLKADDFMKRGVEKGPALGAALRAAEEAWIAAGFPDEARSLDRIAEAAAAGRA
jgi:poly(A) polymerase